MVIKNAAGINKQSGAVLVLALVMLTVLTLVGVASMDSSSMELKVASNTQEHDVAFQSAQAVIAFVTSDDENNPIDYHDISGTDQVLSQSYEDIGLTNQDLGKGYPYPGSIVTDISGDATVTHVGCTAGIGDSLEEGKGQKYNFYDVTATGFNTTGSSSSVQVQGVRYFAAGCG